MFSLEENMNFYVYGEFVDMRRGIPGLYALVCSGMKSTQFLTGNAAFIFFGKDRRSVKIIRYDSGGVLLYHKRLEAGSFEVPQFDSMNKCAVMDFETLEFIIRGVVLGSVRHRRRYKPNVSV